MRFVGSMRGNSKRVSWRNGSKRSGILARLHHSDPNAEWKDRLSVFSEIWYKDEKRGRDPWLKVWVESVGTEIGSNALIPHTPFRVVLYEGPLTEDGLRFYGRTPSSLIAEAVGQLPKEDQT